MNKLIEIKNKAWNIAGRLRLLILAITITSLFIIGSTPGNKSLPKETEQLLGITSSINIDSLIQVILN